MRINMRLKKIQHSLFITVLLLIFIFKVGTIHAETPGFTVNPVIPENQTGSDQGYFNLVMKNGESQDISTVLTNTTSKEITISITFSRATTNGNGLAIYDPTPEKKDTSLTYNIDDYVRIPEKEIVLSAHSQTTVTATVSMPKDDLTGILAGGFTFKEKKTQAATPSKAGVSITNEFRFIVALVMQQNTVPVLPELKLKEVFASQVNSRNVISANLQNTAPTYLKDMAISSTVQGITDKSVKYTYNTDSLKMAPNSNFSFAIPVSPQGDLNNQATQALKPGKYQVALTVYGQKNENGPYQKPTTDGSKPINYSYKWTFDKTFEISKSQATKLNTIDPTIRAKKTINWLVVLLIIIIVVLLLLLWILISRKKEKATHQ